MFTHNCLDPHDPFAEREVLVEFAIDASGIRLIAVKDAEGHDILPDLVDAQRDDLPSDVIQRLVASGFGRGFLTVSLRARLRKAGYRDLGHLAQTSPDAIANIRKFGPIRVERVRTFLLTEIARWLPDARAVHAAEATGARRLERLRGMPVEHLPLDAAIIAALGFAGGSCADMAGRSRLALLATGAVMSRDVDRIITTLARVLGGDGVDASRSVPVVPDGPATEPEASAARRAALLAQQDREWEAAAPAGDWGADS